MQWAEKLLLLLLLHHGSHFKDEETGVQSIACFVIYSLPSDSVCSVCHHNWLTSLSSKIYSASSCVRGDADIPITPARMGPSSHPTTQSNGNKCHHTSPAYYQSEKKNNNKTLPSHLKRRLWWCPLLSHRRSFVGIGSDCSQVREEKE